MRRAFLLGCLGLVLFEALSVYFIMPFPGSQQIPSLASAYLLHQWRWPARLVLGVLAMAGLPDAWRDRRWRLGFLPALGLVVAGGLYAIHGVMAADAMFLQPRVVRMEPAARNTVARDRLVVGIEVDGEARAYPLQFIGYHHQVRDTVAGRPVLVSYCTVCRTGRVFSPVVDGRAESFRLVGMDRFNAMLEDATTGSWWRQANGEAVAGPRRGTVLEELPSRQVTLATWLALYPHSRVMQRHQSQAAHGHRYRLVARQVVGGGDHRGGRQHGLRLESAGAGARHQRRGGGHPPGAGAGGRQRQLLCLRAPGPRHRLLPAG